MTRRASRYRTWTQLLTRICCERIAQIAQIPRSIVVFAAAGNYRHQLGIIDAMS